MTLSCDPVGQWAGQVWAGLSKLKGLTALFGAGDQPGIAHIASGPLYVLMSQGLSPGWFLHVAGVKGPQ